MRMKNKFIVFTIGFLVSGAVRAEEFRIPAIEEISTISSPVEVGGLYINYSKELGNEEIAVIPSTDEVALKILLGPSLRSSELYPNEYELTLHYDAGRKIYHGTSSKITFRHTGAEFFKLRQLEAVLYKTVEGAVSQYHLHYRAEGVMDDPEYNHVGRHQEERKFTRVNQLSPKITLAQRQVLAETAARGPNAPAIRRINSYLRLLWDHPIGYAPLKITDVPSGTLVPKQVLSSRINDETTPTIGPQISIEKNAGENSLTLTGLFGKQWKLSYDKDLNVYVYHNAPQIHGRNMDYYEEAPAALKKLSRLSGEVYLQNMTLLVYRSLNNENVVFVDYNVFDNREPDRREGSLFIPGRKVRSWAGCLAPEAK
jgi:hypothetical protein